MLHALPLAIAITSEQIIEALPVIFSLLIIEGLLSVDNALAIAALARHLPQNQRVLAVRLGLVGAYLFRVVALFFATIIIQNTWLKVAGAAYLIHLMLAHFAGKLSEEDDQAELEAAKVGAHSEHHAPPVGEKARSFLSTVMAIQLMDLSLSVDNVVAAVAMSPKFWVVCTGVLMGIITLMFLAGVCMRLIQKYPVLGDAAFILIGYVGMLLLFEIATHYDLGPGGKFVGIVIILGLAVFYHRSDGFQRMMQPVWAALRWPLRAYASFLHALTLPFRLLFSRGKTA